MSLRLSLAVLLPLAACAGDAPSTAKDAAPTGDGGGNTAASVKEVTCPSSTVPTVDAQNAAGSFTPKDTTVAVNAIVKFTMGTEHDVVPNTVTTTDTGLHVAFGATTCLQFSKAGTFGFACGTHGFAGTVVVQ
jgi:plastocyanin